MSMTLAIAVEITFQDQRKHIIDTLFKTLQDQDRKEQTKQTV